MWSCRVCGVHVQEHVCKCIGLKNYRVVRSILHQKFWLFYRETAWGCSERCRRCCGARKLLPRLRQSFRIAKVRCEMRNCCTSFLSLRGTSYIGIRNKNFRRTFIVILYLSSRGVSPADRAGRQRFEPTSELSYFVPSTTVSKIPPQPTTDPCTNH